jgi:hypothetical protein
MMIELTQAEARFYIEGKDYGVVSADRAADRLGETPDLQADFVCSRCSRPYVAVAIHPRRQPYQVSPHFRLRDGETHREFCPNNADNRNAKRLDTLTRKQIGIEILGTVPQVLELPERLEESTWAPDFVHPHSRCAIANEPTEESTVKRTGTVRTNTVKGIVQFRNDRLREKGDYAQASEILKQIPLLLPGPPPYRLSYDKAFCRLIYPVPHYRIVYGIALVESLKDGVRLISQEVVAATNHPFPSAAGKPALILLPSLEVCTSSDDVRFLRKHQNQRTAFKIYLYSLATLMAGSLVYECQHWPLVEFRPLYRASARSRILEGKL